MENKEKSASKWLMEFADDYKGQYIKSIIYAVIGVIAGMIPYFILGNIVKNLIDGNRDINYYLKWCVIMAVCWIIRVLMHSVSTATSHKATFNVLNNIRKQLAYKLSVVPLGKVKDASSGSLKNIMVERVDSIETTLAHIVPEFTANLLPPVIIFIYMIVIDWRMALISLITFPLGMICYMGMTIDYEKSFKNAVTKTKILNDTAVEYINGIEVIKAFGKAGNSYEKFKIAAKEGADCYVEWMRRCNVYFCLAMILTPCTALTVLPAGAYFVMKGSLSTASFIMCIILSMGLITPIITVMSYSDDMSKMRTIVEEVAGVLMWDNLKRPEKSKAVPANSNVTVENVKFSYNEKEVLHGVNMEMKAGEMTAIVGPSGSGKSTIAKLIASLWDVTEGSIKIGGVDIRDITLEDYNRSIAYVSQDNYLFDDTVRENIRMGKPGASDEEVEEAAKKSGCHQFIMQLEHGYDTVVGGAGGHLSGGERQRIAIARAMLKNAPIIILDEATAYTDPENEAIIQNSVAQLVKGKTLIVIAHRLSTIADAAMIYVIKDGNVAESGTHEKLLSQNGLYKTMWESHISSKDSGEEKAYA